MTGRYALYSVLGLPPQASTDDIKKSYRKLSQKQDPNGKDNGFKKLTGAYQILSDPLKKEEYDRLGDSYDDTVETWDDDLGEMAIPSFMFTAAPYITPFHPFSIYVQDTNDPLKAFTELRNEDRRHEERAVHGHLASISDVEATPDDRVAALRGLLELCAKGSSVFVIDCVLDDDDALPTIIEDIQNEEEDETIKFLSTELLHVVATTNYVDVYQTGGLPAILSVLKTENTKVLHSALLSLQHITQLGSACAECFKCNVVQYCVHLMHKRSVDVLLTASHILHNLIVEHADPHTALAECRKLSCERYFCEIIKVIEEQRDTLENTKGNLRDKSKKKEVKASVSLSLQSQKMLTSVLAVLSGSEESSFISLSKEDLQRLVNMLSYKSVRDVVINGCTVIQALILHKRIKFDGLSMVVEALLEQALALAKLDPAPTVAVILLSQLIHNKLLTPEIIVKREVGKLLVAHLKSRVEETSVAAARGITYLCSPSIVDHESEGGGDDKNKSPSRLLKSIIPHLDVVIKQLLSVVRGTLAGTELRPASVMCAGIAAVAQHDEGRKALLRQPVLESLCALVAKPGADQVEKEASSLAILNLAKVGNAIDPTTNTAHREALKQLASQLHSKNAHIQACTITAFLTLVKDGVKLDCIYGKNLEQLKNTRTNTKVARELYELLTVETTNELNPSAAAVSPSLSNKEKKKLKNGGNVGAKRRSTATPVAPPPTVEILESDNDSSSSDVGGSNMFSALAMGGKKRRNNNNNNNNGNSNNNNNKDDLKKKTANGVPDTNNKKARQREEERKKQQAAEEAKREQQKEQELKKSNQKDKRKNKDASNNNNNNSNNSNNNNNNSGSNNHSGGKNCSSPSPANGSVGGKKQSKQQQAISSQSQKSNSKSEKSNHSHRSKDENLIKKVNVTRESTTARLIDQTWAQRAGAPAPRTTSSPQTQGNEKSSQVAGQSKPTFSANASVAAESGQSVKSSKSAAAAKKSIPENASPTKSTSKPVTKKQPPKEEAPRPSQSVASPKVVSKSPAKVTVVKVEEDSCVKEVPPVVERKTVMPPPPPLKRVDPPPGLVDVLNAANNLSLGLSDNLLSKQIDISPANAVVDLSAAVADIDNDNSAAHLLMSSNTNCDSVNTNPAEDPLNGLQLGELVGGFGSNKFEDDFEPLVPSAPPSRELLDDGLLNLWGAPGTGATTQSHTPPDLVAFTNGGEHEQPQRQQQHISHPMGAIDKFTPWGGPIGRQPQQQQQQQQLRPFDPLISNPSWGPLHKGSPHGHVGPQGSQQQQQQQQHQQQPFVSVNVNIADRNTSWQQQPPPGQMFHVVQPPQQQQPIIGFQPFQQQVVGFQPHQQQHHNSGGFSAVAPVKNISPQQHPLHSAAPGSRSPAMWQQQPQQQRRMFDSSPLDNGLFSGGLFNPQLLHQVCVFFCELFFTLPTVKTLIIQTG